MSSSKPIESIKGKTRAKPAGKMASVSVYVGPSTGGLVPKSKPRTRVVDSKTLTLLANKLFTMESALDEQGKLIQLLLLERGGPTPRAAVPFPPVAPAVTQSPQVSSAAAALGALRSRLVGDTQPFGAGLPVAEASEATKRQWIDSGLLVGWRVLSDAWGGRSRQGLDQACGRGELFNLKIAGKLWYPVMFQRLSADSVKAVCLLLRNVDPVSKMIFWVRPQGALSGQTLAQAIEAGQLDRAAQVAQAFADEYTGHAALA
jgi:hypothetical protein